MNIKRVLIVDDDSSNAIMVRDMLALLGDDYVFEIAYQGDEALAKVEETSYDLVITDYHMPGLTGMNLIDKVQHISPKTKLVLMTAEGSNRLEKVAKYRNVNQYITKPFSIKKMRQVVQLAMAQSTSKADEEQSKDESPLLDEPPKEACRSLRPEEEPSQDESPLLDDPPKEACRSPQAEEEPSQDESSLLDDAISELLKALKAKTGVRSVLLVSSEGYPVDVAGEIAELDMISASALVAGSFSASSELARLLGYHNSTFNSTYYEGDDVNIYVYDINGKMLLAVVFDTQVKSGLVSYYSKQTIAKLAPLLAQQPAPLTWDREQVDETLIAERFDELFEIEG